MDFYQSIHNKVVNVAHKVGEYVTPVLTESHFLDRGVLTPEEFVQAGDQLVHKCPTWAWSAGDPDCRRPYLPADKQYLITRNVPCLRRVTALEADYKEDVELSAEDAGGSDGWLATHGNSFAAGDEEVEVIGDADETGVDATSGHFSGLRIVENHIPGGEASTANHDSGAADDDEYLDMDELVDDSLVDDSDQALLGNETVQSAAGEVNELDASEGFVIEQPPDESDILKTRTYDLSITYDKMYQTPRVWLLGYDEDGQHLAPEKVMEDIMQDYANKTVTMDPHPHLKNGGTFASIHPCRHAPVMKRIVEHLTEGGKKAPRPDQYIFIFLKFIQSVVPTIDYDYTIEVEAQ